MNSTKDQIKHSTATDGKPPVSGSACPKCGCVDYEEWEELEYEKGGDDPMYGGALITKKFTRCGECD